MFAAMHSKYPNVWSKAVSPNTDNLKQFWKDIGNHPVMIGHPVKEKPNYEEMRVPFGWHGDEVPVMGVWQNLEQVCIGIFVV